MLVPFAPPSVPLAPWLGEFDLEALDDADEPVLLDYLSLARTETARSPKSPV